MTEPSNMSRSTITPEDLRAMWNLKLDSDDFAHIARQFPEYSPRAIRRALEGAIPPDLSKDPRLSGYRYAWVYAAAPSKPELAMIVFRMPIRPTSAAFQKGVRAMRRALLNEIPDATVNAAVCEGFELTAEDYAAAERMIWKREQPGFAMDHAGVVTRLDAAALMPTQGQGETDPAPVPSAR